MKTRNLIWLLSLVLSSTVVTAHASGIEVGKIYLNGKWVTAQQYLPAVTMNQNALVIPGMNNSVAGIGLDSRKSAIQFLNDNSALLNLDSSSGWASPSVQRGAGIETHRIAKTWQGLKVMGGEALVHFANGKLLFANADDTALGQLSATPRLSAEDASKLAFASYSGSAVAADAPKLEVLIINNGSAKEARLVYEVTVRDRDMFSSDVHFIDANRGDVLKINSNVNTVAPRFVMSAVGDESDFDFDESTWKPILADQSGCRGTHAPAAQSGWLSDWWSGNAAKPAVAPASSALDDSPTTCQTLDARVMASANAAWTNSGLVHSFYKTVFNRNSIDDHGMQIKSIVNFGGQKFPNAAWTNDKKVMLYGYGDQSKYNDFAIPLDVAGHEMTHGITASTAALDYSSESGALNESYSDVFGKLIAFRSGKGSDWKLGRDLYRDGVGFVRDMENPTIGNNADFQYRGQPCHRFNDFCGVHANSGIPSRAAVLMSKKLGLEKLGKLYYLTLTQLLRSNSNFADARAQTEAACSTLFGAGSEDCRNVSAAFQAVGI
ncbi:MAG: M4 family metallopeptidase [Bdellovibrionota bacterium]